MGFSSPLGNLKGFATSRPPLMVFTLCLTAFALTTLSLAYFIRHNESIPNLDVRADWTGFLKHLNDLDLCVSPDESTRVAGNASRAAADDMELGDGYGNVSIGVRATLSVLKELSLLPHNLTSIVGVLPLGELGNLCATESSAGDATSLNMTLSLPQNLSKTQEVCVTLVGPRSLLPISSAQPSCPAFVPGQGIAARLITRSRSAEALGERVDDTWCREGAIMRMTYHSKPELAVVLTMNDRSLINLHLIHTSYFLFVMAMTLVCYALIKGKPKQKTILIDKVPLDP